MFSPWANFQFNSDSLKTCAMWTHWLRRKIQFIVSRQLSAKLPHPQKSDWIDNTLCRHNEQKQKPKWDKGIIVPATTVSSLSYAIFFLLVSGHRLLFTKASLVWYCLNILCKCSSINTNSNISCVYYTLCLIKCFPLWEIISSGKESSKIDEGEAIICTDKGISHERSYYGIC